MAVLNIKGFPDDLYERLREAARAEHRSMSQQAIHLLERALAEPQRRSLSELRGLGKELWENVEATDYVARERDSWDS